MSANSTGGEGTRRHSRQFWGTILAAVIAAAAVLATVWGQLRIASLESELQKESLNQAEQRRQDEQEQRFEEILATWIPGVIDPDDAKNRKQSRTVLLVLLAEDAEPVFAALEDALEKAEQDDPTIRREVSAARESAEQVAEQTGGWAVQLSANRDYEGAVSDLRRFRDTGETDGDARVVYDGKWFRVALLGFTTEADATLRLERAKSELAADAFVRSVNSMAADTFEVPDVYGQPLSDAVDALEQAGFSDARRLTEEAEASDAVIEEVLMVEDDSAAVLVDASGVVVARVPTSVQLLATTSS